MEKKATTVEFCRQGADDSGIIVEFPSGLTEDEIAKLDAEIQDILEKDEENPNENIRNVYGFSDNLLIELACDNLGFEMNYPKTDSTIWI